MTAWLPCPHLGQNERNGFLVRISRLMANVAGTNQESGTLNCPSVPEPAQLRSTRRQGRNILILLMFMALETLHLPLVRTRRPFRYFWPSRPDPRQSTHRLADEAFRRPLKTFETSHELSGYIAPVLCHDTRNRWLTDIGDPVAMEPKVRFRLETGPSCETRRTAHDPYRSFVGETATWQAETKAVCPHDISARLVYGVSRMAMLH
jgi:hypothetical protein